MDDIETRELLVCRECGKQFKRITGPHVRTHGMSLQDYRDKYPNDITCLKLTEDHKRKISEAKMGTVVPESVRKRIAKTLSNNEEVVNRLKKINTNRIGKPLSESAKIKLSKFHLGKTLTKEHRRKLSLAHKPNGFGRRKWSYEGKNGIIPMRSKWEVRVANYLDKNDYDWKYEIQTFDLEYSTYTPDFFIMEGDKIVKVIEVKGWLRDKDALKIERFIETYPEIPHELWLAEELVSRGISIKGGKI